MALVTVQRSAGVRTDSDDKGDAGAANDTAEDDGSRDTKGLSECYFANKGAALMLPATTLSSGGGGSSGARGPSPVPAEAQEMAPVPAPAPAQPDIQHHLQSMFYLLRPEETLKMAVKLESAHVGRTRYLVVVCNGEEAVLLGIDCNEHTTIGLVLRVLADTAIKLDGDGGFSVCVCGNQHIFKPVSVQAMWSALQTLHRASSRARQHNHFAGGTSHAWAAHYERRVRSDRSCLNEWHAMDCLESRRPPSPDSLRHKPSEREETEKVIRCTLKEIMMTVDLDEVTSKAIRGRLEEDLDMDLGEFKSFIDEEMIVILGQMDAPTEIFEHVYLGSEWNASNLEELQRNGVRHILNVTREIDNFFPGMFDYLNIRVYDDEKTDLLKHWDNTFKYITKARNEGSKVLVHCKMGISRSASVVIAYAMKAYNWNFERALRHVKEKRNCIKPNANFVTQLETYQGILDAMKNREKLQRSKSETNLKSASASRARCAGSRRRGARAPAGGGCGGWGGARPRSWSPDTRLDAFSLLPPTSVSLEHLAAETRHMLMPCANGTYSVSPNQIMHITGESATSVKHRVHELESLTTRRRRRALQKDRTHAWDPGERRPDDAEILKSDSGIVDAKPMPDLAPPSRQSSCSSFDSAVGVDLSRNSSWGSYDTRSVKNQTLESLRDDAALQCATVKKAKQKLDEPSSKREDLGGDAAALQSKIATDLSIISESREPHGKKSKSVKTRADTSDNERKFNETCAILKQLAYGGCGRSWRAARSEPSVCWARLSTSALAAGDSWPRRARLRPASASYGDLPASAAASASALRRHASGRVENLKKEFEARSGLAPEPPDADLVRRNSKMKTVADKRTSPRGSIELEDLSVKVLVDKYDGNKGKSVCEPKRGKSVESNAKKVRSRCVEGGASRTPTPMRNSFCDVVRSGADRPPIAPNVVAMAPINYPNVVMTSVLSKAHTKKQLQHGKTHPLTRLNLNRSSNRCSNPVYNTM